MRTSLRFSFFLSFLALLSVAQATEEMTYRYYPVDPALFSTFSEPPPSETENEDGFGGFQNFDSAEISNTEDIIATFTGYGVQFPEGSSLKYYHSNSMLVHFNTMENHERMHEVMSAGCCKPSQIQLDALYIQFEHSEIETLIRTNSHNIPGSSQILDLWKQGNGKLLYALKTATMNGVNAESQAGNILHPNKECCEAPQATQPNTKELKPPSAHATKQKLQYTGALINFTPTLSANETTVNLTIVAELSYRTDTATVKHQDASHGLSTSLFIKDQSTVVMGGWASPYGETTTYLFLTATIIDSAGKDFDALYFTSKDQWALPAPPAEKE